MSSLLVAGTAYVLTRVRPGGGGWWALTAGVLAGLLLLARGNKLLVVVAVEPAAYLRAGRGRRAAALGALAWLAAAAIISPWAARDCLLLERFMPLGTQAGEHLPDGYSDMAWQNRGLHTGRAMADLVREVRDSDPGALGDALRAHPPDRIEASLSAAPVAAYWVYFNACAGTRVEADLAAAGQRRAADWVPRNPAHAIALVPMKVRAELRGAGGIGCALALATAVFVACPSVRRELAIPLTLSACVVLMIGLTHAVGGRFLIPIGPTAALAGAVALLPVLDRVQAGRPSAPGRPGAPADD